MNVISLGAITTAITLGMSSFAVSANDNNNGGNHNWMPNQPTNSYWEAPNFNMPSFNSAPPAYNAPPQGYMQQQRQNRQQRQNPQQGQNNNYRQQPAPNYNRPYQGNNYQAPNRNQQNMNRAAPQPPQNAYRGNPYPPQPRGPYQGQNMHQNNRDSGASAYNIPGYNRNNNRNNSGWNNNKFWGKSGPSRWMNPNKGNMEQGWDDMINAPSRMGDMPGGWSAPEVTMPNPIDMGDQMQDNVQDLPEQMKNMDVGN